MNAEFVIVAMRKGNDGLVHAAVCGGQTGAINIFRIDAAALEKAKALGFGAKCRRMRTP